MQQMGNDAALWSRLSDKQRACLDLLLERRTSKQMARTLGISKPTVDQRIAAARVILGAGDRDEAARIYARLKTVYDRNIYDPVQLPEPPKFVPSHFPDGDPANVVMLSDARSRGFEAETGQRGLFPSSRDLWRHDNSLRVRIMIMAAMLAALLVILLAGLGIAQALTELISG